MRFITIRTIKPLSLVFSLLNAGVFAYAFLTGSLSIEMFILSAIFQFLILLFYFLSTIYFVWINDQLSKLAQSHDAQVERVRHIEYVAKSMSERQETISKTQLEFSAMVERFFVRFFQLRSRLVQEYNESRLRMDAFQELQKAQFEKITSIDSYLEKQEPNIQQLRMELKNLQTNLTALKSNEDEWRKDSKKQLRSELTSMYGRLDALIGIHHRLKFRSLIPIMEDWRVTSDFAHLMLRRLFNMSNPSILDIGSGISTILCGYAVQELGGMVISLEHDKFYYEQTLSMLEEHALTKYVKLYHCPLIEYEIENRKWLWYDTSRIRLPKAFSMIIVDGPSGNVQPMSRFPAMPLLSERLDENTVILVDDANRSDERRMAQEWAEKYNLKLETHSGSKGIITLVSK